MLNNQIKVLSPLKLVMPQQKATASKTISADDVQPDLLYMDSVLVSTGQNANDDVFLPNEMWEARNSPVLKPVDWEHNTGQELLDSKFTELENSKQIISGNQIIGVMYNSFAALKNGTVIDKVVANEAPREFDIINQAVIYKYLFPKTAKKIVTDAKANRLFVSMEAWFNSYDYKLGNKIVARNESTAFLDSHLRANGGNGLFGQMSIGRVLRNIVFGGIGIVANPANKDSVIHSFTNADLINTEIVDGAIASNIIDEIKDASASDKSREVIEIMSDNKTNDAPATLQLASVSSDDYKDVVQRLVKAEQVIEQKDAEVVSVKSEVEKLQSNVENLTTAFIKGAKTLEDTLGVEAAVELSQADASDFFTVLTEIVEKKLSVSKGLEDELAKASEKVVELETEKRQLARSSSIESVLAEFIDDVEKLAERKDKMVEATKNLDDESFASYIEDTKSLLSLAAKPAWLQKKDEKDGEEKKGEKKEDMKEEDGAKKAKCSEEEDGITDVTILDSVKATASVSAGTEDVDSGGQEDKWQGLATELLGAVKKNQETTGG